LEDRKVFAERDSDRFLNVFAPSAAKNASHFTVLRVLHYFRSLGQEGETATGDFVPMEALFEQFEPQGLASALFEADLKRLARFGLVATDTQDADKVNSSTRFAITKSGLYYLDTLYHNTEYVALMTPDTLIVDTALAQTIAGILRPSMHMAKLPVWVRIDIATAFLDYLGEREERETSVGAVAKHPVFGGHRFVPAMRRSLHQVVAAVERKGGR
jgi:hypothetical protein